MKIIKACWSACLGFLMLGYLPFCLASSEGVWGIQEVPSGGMLEGLWVNHKAHGRMTYIRNDFKLYYFFNEGENLGSSRYHYSLRNYSGGYDEFGRRSGFGVFNLHPRADEIYIGEWEEDKQNGIGVYFLSNGKVVMGFYKDDIKQGEVFIISPNGRTQKVKYSGGEEREVTLVERGASHIVGLDDSSIEFYGDLVVYRNSDEVCSYDFENLQCDDINEQ